MTSGVGPASAPGAPADRPVVRAGPPADVVEPAPVEPAPVEPVRVEPAPVELGAGLFPPRPERRRIRPAASCAVVGVVAAGVLTGLATERLAPGPGQAGHWAAGRVGSAPAWPGPTRYHLIQYDYALRVPAGWRHSGGLPERRRTVLTPIAAPAGSDLIAVEQTPIGYDAAAEPDRARAELADRFRVATEADPALRGPLRHDRVGGRPVVTYRQQGGALTTDWYVLFDRDAQLSVGCRHTPTGAAAVAAACAQVLASLVHRER